LPLECRMQFLFFGARLPFGSQQSDVKQVFGKTNLVATCTGGGRLQWLRKLLLRPHNRGRILGSGVLRPHYRILLTISFKADKLIEVAGLTRRSPPGIFVTPVLSES
jgi:hypothetical protein